MRAALRVILRDEPAVIGVGEYHQTEGDPKVASALQRFTRRALPRLRRRISDMVVETWVTEGTCGAREREVVEDVERTTERPDETENEILTLITRARRYRIRPHILTLSCDHYRELLGGEGVDYERLLSLTAEKLRDKVMGIAKVRLDPVKRAVDDSLREAWGNRAAGKRDLILVYGGAVHNDLWPDEALAAYTYAPAVSKVTAGRYVELDLVVPEFIENASSLVKDKPWYQLFQQKRSTRHLLLIRRAERSYVLVLRRSRKPKR
jgi:hypothetical protein